MKPTAIFLRKAQANASEKGPSINDSIHFSPHFDSSLLHVRNVKYKILAITALQMFPP